MTKIFTLGRSGNSGARGQRDVTGVEGRGVEGTRWSGIGVRAKSQASGGQESGARRQRSGGAASREAVAVLR
jgi:hypothetical protein